MPTYDKLTLGRKARELGFARDAFEKMSRLTEVLRFIGADRELNPRLALKGGTSINLTVFNLPRLSVDIDMDFTENLSKDETAAERERINELIGRHMASEGYTLKGKSKHTHALDSFVYSYTNAAGNPDTVKIEINYSLRCHALPIVSATVRTGETFPDFPVRTLAPVEVFASKIVALTDRGAARSFVSGRVAEITPHKIKTDLYPMIRNAERFDLQAARDRVSAFLNEHMTPAGNENDFLQRFAAGSYEPKLLFEDGEISKRVTNHPMALWRIRHRLRNSLNTTYLK
jgi:predicted nucleotidyltransferase component of viral defense system